MKMFVISECQIACYKNNNGDNNSNKTKFITPIITTTTTTTTTTTESPVTPVLSLSPQVSQTVVVHVSGCGCTGMDVQV